MTEFEEDSEPNGDTEEHVWTNVAERPTGEDMDIQRERMIAYNYLCRLEEAKRWLEACIREEIPKVTDGMDESLANGVTLAKLAKFVWVDAKFRIYDEDLKMYNEHGLNFRHTDNINAFRVALEKINFPAIFYPETTDIYDMKNLPRLCYCIHALSMHLFKLGRAPQIQDLEGILKFTEEEITAMQEALDKYGLQLPIFSKIGGILASEISIDEAVLHAAIMLINQALDDRDSDKLREALKNPDAFIDDVFDERIDQYQDELTKSKDEKALNIASKELNDSVESPDRSFVIEEDLYSIYLTQLEIQGHVKRINKELAFKNILIALNQKDDNLLEQSMRELQINDFKKDNCIHYFDAADLLDEIRIKPLQDFITTVNEKVNINQERNMIVEAVKQSIRNHDETRLLSSLCHPSARLPSITNARPDIYLTELESYDEEVTSDLLEQKIGGISAVVRINEMLDNGNDSVEELLGAMNELNINSIDDRNKVNYMERLVDEHDSFHHGLNANLNNSHDSKNYITREQLQQIVEATNRGLHDDSLRLEAVQAVNQAVIDGDEEIVLQTLQNSILNLGELHENHTSRYLALLQRHLESNEELWLNAIEDAVETCHQQFEIMKKKCSAVLAINLLLLDEDVDESQFLEMLQTDVLNLTIIDDCLGAYIDALLSAKHEKEMNGAVDSGWICEVISQDNSLFYFDTNNFTGHWTSESHPDFTQQLLLTSDEIRNQVEECSEAFNKVEEWRSNEHLLIKIQSFARMFMQKRRYNARLQYLKSQETSITVIQAYYRGWKSRTELRNRRFLWHRSTKEIVKIQSLFRMLRARLQFRRRLEHFRHHEEAIIRIQAWWRGCYIRNDYQGLTSNVARLGAVRHFVHLLDRTMNDLEEEDAICKLKKEVIRRIRENDELESGLTSMDVKIGLLVRNRISLEEAHTHLKKIKKQKSAASISTANLGRMNKETRVAVNNYERLFTLLQTEPDYLAKLLFCMTVVKSTTFMQQVVFATFDWAQNKREEYLLLNLFKSALQEEIRQKVKEPKDLMTSNSLVVKLIVNFYRGIGMSVHGSNSEQTGKASLRDILGERVKQIIDRSQHLHIEWNPRDIYRQWVQKKETATGEQAELKHDATIDEALKVPEVKEILVENISTLCTLVEGFLNAITGSASSLPYGLRYIARILFESLQEKFPNEKEETLLLPVGNLIYYRFLNPAICAPEAFDVIDLQKGEATLNSDVRKNLGQIARFLQTSAGSQIIHGNAVSSALPAYLSEFEEIKDANLNFARRFQTFFKAVINVADPGELYGITEYSEATAIQKPQITLSIKDILATHRLCQEHQEAIAPHHADPLHDVMQDLKEVPAPETLLAVDTVNSDCMEVLNNTIVLKLQPQTTLTDEQLNAAELARLLNETKKLICHACQVQNARNIDQLLAQESSLEQREMYTKYSDGSDFEDDKKKIGSNLETLCNANIIATQDDIIKLISKDIKEQHRLRARRKQELEKLQNTKRRLVTKGKYYEEQANYYERYITDCLAKQTAVKEGKRRKSIRTSFRSKSTSSSVKYSAEDLRKKGVLIEIINEDISSYKRLQFIITPTENIGQWNVTATYLGVNVLTTRLVLQDLLQKQYEGVSFTTLDGKAKVNVNLLIHLLNKKFHTSSLKQT